MQRLGIRWRALFEPSGRIELSSKIFFAVSHLFHQHADACCHATRYARDACANSHADWAIIDFVFTIQKIDG
jgi:hypothetical protein